MGKKKKTGLLQPDKEVGDVRQSSVASVFRLGTEAVGIRQPVNQRLWQR